MFRIDDLMVSVLPEHRAMADDGDCTACTDCTDATEPPSTCGDADTGGTTNDDGGTEGEARLSRHDDIEALLVAQLDQELATRS